MGHCLLGSLSFSTLPFPTLLTHNSNSPYPVVFTNLYPTRLAFCYCCDVNVIQTVTHMQHIVPPTLHVSHKKLSSACFLSLMKHPPPHIHTPFTASPRCTKLSLHSSLFTSGRTYFQLFVLLPKTHRLHIDLSHLSGH